MIMRLRYSPTCPLAYSSMPTRALTLGFLVFWILLSLKTRRASSGRVRLYKRSIVELENKIKHSEQVAREEEGESLNSLPICRVDFEDPHICKAKTTAGSQRFVIVYRNRVTPGGWDLGSTLSACCDGTDRNPSLPQLTYMPHCCFKVFGDRVMIPYSIGFTVQISRLFPRYMCS